MKTTKRQHVEAAHAAVDEAAKASRFGAIVIHFPAGKKQGMFHLYPWKMSAGDAMAVIQKLQEHFGLPTPTDGQPPQTV